MTTSSDYPCDSMIVLLKPYIQVVFLYARKSKTAVSKMTLTVLSGESSSLRLLPRPRPQARLSVRGMMIVVSRTKRVMACP